jgi:flagellar M-ring protein FliF
MAGWQGYWPRLKVQIFRVPAMAWAVFGVIAVSLAVVFALQAGGPPYVALYDGLSPADGGKVIAELQKLGIPYQLQAAGNVILVPAPQLSSARLQLGASGVPGDNVSTGWDRLEDAPMTASDLAQSTMAVRALEASLAETIDNMEGISAAQIYLAMPPDTPFLADQPKPTASVIISASSQDAQSQGAAIAKLVAGAVVGLAANDVSVATTSGLTVFPTDGSMLASTQFSTVAEVESTANARISQLLTPLVGYGNFRSDVAANVDFTQAHIHQISYGPTNLVTHEISSQSSGSGGQMAGFGIPGAMTNEPPAPTNAVIPPASGQASANSTPSGASAAAVTEPKDVSKKLDQTYVTDVSDSDVTKPDWTVKSIAVSVVLNKVALGSVTTEQVKTAIAGAFAYPQVTVNVLAAPFQAPEPTMLAGNYFHATGPVTQALLELLAAVAFLFGVALPLGRRLSTVGVRQGQAALTNRPMPATLPPPDFSALRDVARGNPAGVARLLQNWADENE